MTSVTRYPRLGTLACVDPGPLYDDNQAISAQTEFWGRANSYTSEIGQEAGTAWVLLTREAYDELDTDSTQTLIWHDDGTEYEFPGLVVESAYCQGIDGDGKAPYLVKLRDIRFLLANSGAYHGRFNMSAAMPEGTYSSVRRYDVDTTNGGTAWTWQEMFDEVWDALPAAAGASPTLPWTPPHEPQSWRFDGKTAWEAIGMILAACQSAISCDPFSGTLSVVALGDTHTGLAAAIADAATLTIRNWRPAQDCNLGGTPETIRVAFRTRHRSPNTIEALDIHYRDSTYIDTATGLTGAQAGRVRVVWTDLFDERNDNNVVLNAAEKTATASAISSRLIARYQSAGQNLRLDLSGVVDTVVPGEQIHRVVWRDYGDEDGLVTEWHGLAGWGEPSDAVVPVIRREARLALVELTSGSWGEDNGWAYMDDCRIVRYFTAANEYDTNEANEQNIRVYHPTGYPDGFGPDIRALHVSTGRWPQKHGSGDWCWAAYDEVSQRWELLAPYEDHWRFTLKTAMGGGSATAYLVLGDWNETTYEFDVWDSRGLFPRALIGCKGFAKYFSDSGKFEVLNCNQMVFMMRASLSGDMCDGTAIAGITGHARMSWEVFGKLPSPLPATANNPHNLQGEAGDAVTLLFNDTQDAWDIVQVDHKATRVTRTIRHNDCVIERSSVEIAVMYCDGSTQWDTVVSMTPTDVVTSVEGELADNTADAGSGSSQCIVSLNYDKLRICALQPATPVVTLGSTELIRATPRRALEHIKHESGWIQELVGIHYVICYENPEWENAIQTTPCASGSGSGGA